MSESLQHKVLSSLKTSIEKGSSPVELAGYGREAVHKGYLNWIFDSRRWTGARDALICLADHAIWEDVKKKDAIKWFRKLGQNLQTKNEAKVGRRRVDIGIECTNDDGEIVLVPMELKVDSGLSSDDQLTDMVPANSDNFGLVLALGSTALREDVELGGFGWLTPESIVEAFDQNSRKHNKFFI